MWMSALQTTVGVNTCATTSQGRSSVAVTLGTSWMKTEGAASVSASSELPQVPPLPPVPARTTQTAAPQPCTSPLSTPSQHLSSGRASPQPWEALSVLFEPGSQHFPKKCREFWHSYTSNTSTACSDGSMFNTEPEPLPQPPASTAFPYKK